MTQTNAISQTSLLSFPSRGPWGDAGYRGNCSGHVYRELFQALKPSSFCDPMMGSGTSIEVAHELGIEAHGFDLRLGFNAVTDSILQAVGQPVDFCCSHPPYHDVVLYSGPGNVWGSEPHPGDLSRCRDDAEFNSKLQLVLMNQRDAVRGGGHYSTIIGDRRASGSYSSYQAEAIARMPADELVAVLVKVQHGVQSDRKAYRNFALPRIAHEYILIWRKRERKTFDLLRAMAVNANTRLRDTWRAIVHMCLLQLGGEAALPDIHGAVRSAADERCERNEHWQAKIRQVLNQGDAWFESNARGVWRIKAPS